jgi:hypothetical protein
MMSTVKRPVPELIGPVHMMDPWPDYAARSLSDPLARADA